MHCCSGETYEIFDLVRKNSSPEHQRHPCQANPSEKRVAGGDEAVKTSSSKKALLMVEAGVVGLEKRACDFMVDTTNNPETSIPHRDDKISDSHRMSTGQLHRPMKSFNNQLTIDSVSEQNLRQGADRVIDALHTDEHGHTPLHQAVEHGFLHAVQALLAAGADVTIRSPEKECAALDIAASLGHLDIIRELTKHGAAIHATDSKGQTALHRAAFANEASAVDVLVLETKAHVDAQDSGGRTPLHGAAAKGSVDALRALLKHGASMVLDKKGLSPLHLAAKRGHVSSSRALLDAGVEVTLRNIIGESSALDLAAISGHIEVLETIIAHVSDVNASDSAGRTALHRAACFDKSASINRLVRAGANPEARDRRLGWTPLHDAAAEGCLNAIVALLRHGVEKDVLDIDGRSPLHLAAEEGHLRAVQSLLSAGADASLRYGKSELNVLNVALLEGHLDVVMEVLERGVDVDAADSRGFTALHHAAFADEPEAIVALLKAEASVEARDSSETTALLVAAEHGSACAAEALLDGGANVNFRGGPGDAEWSALDLAAVRGHLDTMAKVVRHGADVNARNSRGYTALHHAAFANKPEAISSLADAGADVGAVDAAGWSPLHDAASEGASDAVAALLRRGANGNLLDNEGRSALHLAAQYGHTEATELLLTAGTDVTLRFGKSENTPLDSAVVEGHLSVMRAIIRRGADVNAVDSVGRTALYRAAFFNQVEAIDALVNAGASMSQADEHGRTPLYIATARNSLEAAAALSKHSARADAPGRTVNGSPGVQESPSRGGRVDMKQAGRRESPFFSLHHATSSVEDCTPTSEASRTAIEKWSEREMSSEHGTESGDAAEDLGGGGGGSARARILPGRSKACLVGVDSGKNQVSHQEKGPPLPKTRDGHAQSRDVGENPKPTELVTINLGARDQFCLPYACLLLLL